MDYTINLTESEKFALEYITTDVLEWILNAAKNRAAIATDEICNIYIQHKLENNLNIEATSKPEMVLLAYQEGLVKTAEERNQEFVSNQSVMQ